MFGCGALNGACIGCIFFSSTYPHNRGALFFLILTNNESSNDVYFPFLFAKCPLPLLFVYASGHNQFS